MGRRSLVLERTPGPGPGPLRMTGRDKENRFMESPMQPAAPPVVEDLDPAHSALPLVTFFEVACHLHRRAEEVLGEMGLSYRAYALLEHLHDANGTISRNARALDGHSGSADALVLDPLEKQGLIQRVRDGAHLRVEL